MVAGEHEFVVRFVDAEVSGGVTGGPDGLQRPVAELQHLAVLQHTVGLDIHTEAATPGTLGVVAVPQSTEGAADVALQSAGRTECPAESDRALPVSGFDLSLGDAVTDQPVVRLFLPVVKVEPAVTDPFPFPLEHDEFAIRGLLFDPASHAEVVGVGVGDDQAGDVAGLATALGESVGHGLGGLVGAIASVEEGDAVRLLEDVGHHEGEAGGVHGGPDLMEPWDDLHGGSSPYDRVGGAGNQSIRLKRGAEFERLDSRAQQNGHPAGAHHVRR